VVVLGLIFLTAMLTGPFEAEASATIVVCQPLAPASETHANADCHPRSRLRCCWPVHVGHAGCTLFLPTDLSLQLDNPDGRCRAQQSAVVWSDRIPVPEAPPPRTL